ncbi:MAG: hypothetical protein QNJ98_07870 [Planctomycetota bacterium]|nr:hypothetical protein [Planctomycetota bacterium]
MASRIVDRSIWFACGLGAALLGFWISSLSADPGPSEREEQIARDLRIAKEVERDLARLRLKEAEQRNTFKVRHPPTRGHWSSPLSEPQRPKFETMKPTSPTEMIGRYTDDDTNTIWVELFEDGRYEYEGIPGEFLEGPDMTEGYQVITQPDGTVIRRPIWRTRRTKRIVPGYAQSHAGTWTFENGVFVMEPYDPMDNAYLTFTWNKTEAAINVRFLGVAPSHLTQTVLRRIVKD